MWTALKQGTNKLKQNKNRQQITIDLNDEKAI